MKIEARSITIGAGKRETIFDKRAGEGKELTVRGIKTSSTSGAVIYLYIDENLQNPDGWTATALNLQDEDKLEYSGNHIKIECQNTGNSEITLDYVILYE